MWYVKISGIVFKDFYDDSFYDHNAQIETWEYKRIYIGNKEDVIKVLELKYKKYTIEKFNIKKHFEILCPTEEYKDAYKLKIMGDIVEYQGKIYMVMGFSHDKAYLRELENKRDLNFKEELEIEVDIKENIKLLKSRYWDLNRK